MVQAYFNASLPPPWVFYLSLNGSAEQKLTLRSAALAVCRRAHDKGVSQQILTNAFSLIAPGSANAGVHQIAWKSGTQSGVVTEKNSEVQSEPVLLNSDPYGEGWLFKIQLNKGADLSGLLDKEPDADS